MSFNRKGLPGVNDRNVGVVSVENLKWLRKTQPVTIVGDPRRTLRYHPIAVFWELHATEPETLLQLLADVWHAHHAAGGKAERYSLILLAG